MLLNQIQSSDQTLLDWTLGYLVGFSILRANPTRTRFQSVFERNSSLALILLLLCSNTSATGRRSFCCVWHADAVTSEDLRMRTGCRNAAGTGAAVVEQAAGPVERTPNIRWWGSQVAFQRDLLQKGQSCEVWQMFRPQIQFIMMKKEQEIKFILMIYGSYKQILTGFIILFSFPLVFNNGDLWNSLHALTANMHI